MKVNMNRIDGLGNRDPRAITLDAAFRSRSYYLSKVANNMRLPLLTLNLS